MNKSYWDQQSDYSPLNAEERAYYKEDQSHNSEYVWISVDALLKYQIYERIYLKHKRLKNILLVYFWLTFILFLCICLFLLAGNNISNLLTY